MTTENKNDGVRSPGSQPETVKVDLTFEEAVSRAMKVPKPPEGFPDFRKRQRRGKGEQDG